MTGARLLLWPAWRGFVRSLTWRSLLRASPFILMGIAMWAALHAGTRVLLGLVRETGPLGDLIALKLLAMTFASLTGFLFLSSLLTAISAFYLSRDLPLLLTRPVTPAALAAYKGMEAAAASTWMVVIFAPAIVFAYGAAYGAGPFYYLLSVVALIPYAAIPAGAGVALAHVLARLFPVGRTRDALMGLGLAVFLAAYYLVQSAASTGAGGIEGLIEGLLRVRADSPLLPGTWMMLTLWPALLGGAPDLLHPLLLVANAAFFAALGQAAGVRLHIGNYLRMNASGSQAPRGRGTSYPGRALALFWKDARLFVRDAEQWPQLTVIGALMAVYLYNLKTLPVEAFLEVTPLFREAAAMLNLALAGLVLSAVAARFIYVGVSLEGGAFWAVRSAPVSMAEYLRAKYLGSAIPVAALMTVLILVSSRLLGLGPGLTLLSASTMLLLSLSVGGLALGMGALNPRFRHESIAAVAMGPWSVVFMAMAFLLVLCTAGIEAWALFILRSAEIEGRSATAWEALRAGAMAAGAIGINILALWYPLRAGARKLEGDLDSG